MDSRSEGELVIDEGPSLQLTKRPSPETLVEVRVDIGGVDETVLNYEPEEEEGKSTNGIVTMSKKYTT